MDSEEAFGQIFTDLLGEIGSRRKGRRSEGWKLGRQSWWVGNGSCRDGFWWARIALTGIVDLATVDKSPSQLLPWHHWLSRSYWKIVNAMTTSETTNMKVALILIAGTLLFVYRFVFPWTPFWIDISVILGVALVAIWEWGSKVDSAAPDKDKDEVKRPPPP